VGSLNILDAGGHWVDTPVEWTVVGAGGHGVDAQGKMDLSGRKWTAGRRYCE